MPTPLREVQYERRSFLVDVLLCQCGSHRRVLAAIAQPRLPQEALRRLGLPSSSPPVAPARWASQDELDLPPAHSGADPPFHDEVYTAS